VLLQLHYIVEMLNRPKLTPQRIDFKLAVLVYKWLYGLACACLAGGEFWSSSVFDQPRHHSLIVHVTRLSTVTDRAFPVAETCTWNSLPQHIWRPAASHCPSQDWEVRGLWLVSF